MLREVGRMENYQVTRMVIKDIFSDEKVRREVQDELIKVTLNVPGEAGEYASVSNAIYKLATAEEDIIKVTFEETTREGFPLATINLGELSYLEQDVAIAIYGTLLIVEGNGQTLYAHMVPPFFSFDVTTVYGFKRVPGVISVCFPPASYHKDTRFSLIRWFTLLLIN